MDLCSGFPARVFCLDLRRLIIYSRARCLSHLPRIGPTESTLAHGMVSYTIGTCRKPVYLGPGCSPKEECQSNIGDLLRGIWRHFWNRRIPHLWPSWIVANYLLTRGIWRHF